MSILAPLLEREPSPPQPITVDQSQIRELGTIGRHLWFTVKGQPGEYELLNDERAIPDRGPARLTPGEVYVESTNDWQDARGGSHSELIWITTRRWPAGTFANGGRAPAAPPKAKRTKPLRSVDALGTLPALAPRRAELVAFAAEKEERIEALAPGVDPEAVVLPKLPRSPGAFMSASRRPVRGTAAMLGILNKAGVTLQPDRYQCHLDVLSAGGALVESGRELIAQAAPLLAAALGASKPAPAIDGPLLCHGTAHTGEPPLAVTLGPAGCPLCEECVG